MSAAHDILNDPLAIKAELSKQSLRHFVKQFWHVNEPATKYISNWHIDAKCEHLEAAINGEITRLVINEPPRMSKSTASTVMAPVWSWIKRPSLRWLCGSYVQTLSTRDARHSRLILESDYFSLMQGYWGTNIQFASDQNQKQRYENQDSGYRLAIATEGSATGEGGDHIIFDDPHNVQDGESDTERKKTLKYCRETLPSRLNNRRTGAIIYVMQRVHHDDATNEAIVEMGYEHLNLAMEYDPRCIVDFAHKCSLTVISGTGSQKQTVNEGTSIGFKDPRTTEGEPLCPERFDTEDCRQLEKEMGSYAYRAQCQQQPTAREGGMFKKESFDIVDVIPSPIKKIHRGWDKAGTKNGGARSAGVQMAELVNGMLCVMDCNKFQKEAPEREKRIKKQAIIDGVECKISIEQEPGSGGKESAQATVTNLRGFSVKVDRVTGDKVVRAEPWATAVENGDVILLRGAWNKEYVDEHTQFPNGKFKDQVDASSQTFTFLNNMKQANV